MPLPAFPAVTVPAAISLGPVKIGVGDTNEVATKFDSAFRQLTRFFTEAATLEAEINAAIDWINAAVESVSDVAPRRLDVGGAERGSEDYFAALATIGLALADVLAARELVIQGIAVSGRAPTSDVMFAEERAGDISWAGPLLPVTIPPPGENAAPIAEAGGDATLVLGETLTRSGAESIDLDGQVAAYEWRLGATILSTDETLVYTPSAAGDFAITLFVTDDDGATSQGDSFRLVVVEPDEPEYEVAVKPTFDPPKLLLRNFFDTTRVHRSSRAPAWTADARHLILGRAPRTSTKPTTYDVIDLDGRVIRSDIRTERDAVASRTDPDVVYGIRDFASGYNLIRFNWRGDSSKFDVYYENRSELRVGDGLGRTSDDDRWIVIRRLSGDALVCVDLRANVVVGSVSAPSDYDWATITPDGEWIVVGTSTGLWRHRRDFSGRTALGGTDAECDIVRGADGRMYVVQGGPTPRLIDIAASTGIAIDTGGQSAQGEVSGASLVPGYIAVAWRVGNVHEIATLDVADGSAMWANRVTWHVLPDAVETRAYATPAPQPSPDGRAILFRSSDSPGSGDVHLYLIR